MIRKKSLPTSTLSAPSQRLPQSLIVAAAALAATELELAARAAAALPVVAPEHVVRATAALRAVARAWGAGGSDYR